MTTKKNGAFRATKAYARSESSHVSAATPDSLGIGDPAEWRLLDQVDPGLIDLSPFQHRTVFDAVEMDELRTDIEKHGIHTTLIVRRHPNSSDRFELVAGERRLRCATELKMPVVPVFIRLLTDRQVQELQWGENFRRVNPNPLDEAKGLKHMLAYHKTIDGLARYISKPRAYVLTRLQLLNLIDPIQEATHAGVFNLKDSLDIACLDAASQEAFFKEHCQKWKEKKGFRIRDLASALYPYRCDLDRAIFDVKDKDLVPEAGACIRCPFNSSTYQSLFPETATRAICSRQECYRKKSQAQLKVQFRHLVGQEQPTAIVISGRPGESWQALLEEIPESSSWPRYDWSDVSTVDPPEEPEREVYEDEDLPGGFDEETFSEAMEEYHAEQKEFEESMLQGRVQRALLIEINSAKVIFIDPKPGGATAGQAGRVSAALVKDAIKTGTATPELLQAEITRLRDREKRSQELDREKVQKEVHAQFSQRLCSSANDSWLTPADELGRRLLIYQALDYQGRGTLHEQIPFEEEAADGKRRPVTDWLHTLTESQVAFMTRLAVACKTEATMSGYASALALVQMAEGIGIDVNAIRAEQEAVADARQQRLTERIAEMEVKIGKLQEKQTAATCQSA